MFALASSSCPLFFFLFLLKNNTERILFSPGRQREKKTAKELKTARNLRAGVLLWLFPLLLILSGRGWGRGVAVAPPRGQIPLVFAVGVLRVCGDIASSVSRLWLPRGPTLSFFSDLLLFNFV